MKTMPVVCVWLGRGSVCDPCEEPRPSKTSSLGRGVMVRGSRLMPLHSSLSLACEDPPAVLLEVQGTLQRPVGRDSRSSPANCTWLILGRKEQTVTVR